MYARLLKHLALPAVSKITRSRFWDLYQGMVRLEAASPEKIQAVQWERFERLLLHTWEKVPLYRKRMEAAGVSPDNIKGPADLARLPVTTKADIQRHFPDGVTAQGSPKSDWQYVSTRGTADRLMAIHDFHKRDVVRATALRSLILSGDYSFGSPMAEIPPNICNVVCGLEGEVEVGVLTHLWQMTRQFQWRDAKQVSNLRGLIERRWFYNRSTYPPFGPDGTHLPDERMRQYIELLRRERPYLVKALPTYLRQIARFAVKTNAAPLNVPVVKPMGGSVSSAMKAAIRRGFAGEYREDYGSAEFGDMACDCHRQDGLHVFSDVFIIEIMRQGKPALPGELGRVVVTDLSNLAMPFIRYAIGDLGRLVETPCACGRPTPRLYLEGRVQDAIVNETGGITTSDSIMDLFYSREEIDEFQLIEKRPGKFELLVVASNGAVPTAEALTPQLGELIGQPVELEVFPVRTIKPEGSGKFRYVKSCSHERLN